MKIVFSMGGSIIAPDNIDQSFVGRASDFLIKLSKSNTLAVVVGGGAPARRRIVEAREKGASEAECDYVGILATRENAKALIDALDRNSNQGIPESVRDAVKSFGSNILVMGGTEPGHSTDAVAALLAEWTKADLLINASNVDAVYDKDPRKFKDAKPLKSVRIDDLIRLLEGQSVAAGQYPLLDPTSLKLIKRSSIRTIVLDGRNLPNMADAISGKKFSGTEVTF
ncbi:MAG: UMP kinase [Candidatus Altiarchaeota archaeon]|nr:UMP kinase [Candidatus Altiarchaeota archaeon]